MNRRDLLRAAPIAALPLFGHRASAATGKPPAKPGPVVLFSKFFPQLPPKELAQAAKAAGYAGIDLTVRPKGHILPEEVAQKLPPALEAIRSEGLDVPIITTELQSAEDPAARPTIATAGKHGVLLFKPGYWKYEYKDVRRELHEAGAKLRGLAQLAKQSKIKLGFHNHGTYIGAPIWDAEKIVAPLDPKWAGYYLDTRHIFAEGGQSVWKAAVHLLAPRVIAVSVKDFYWDKSKSATGTVAGSNGWVVKKCPLGEGMVDFAAVFKILASYGFSGPISLHLEYPIEGGEKATLAAATRDRQVLETALKDAYA